MSIERSALISGLSDAIVSSDCLIEYIKNKKLNVCGRLFSSTLSTEQLAGQYAYESVDKEEKWIEGQISYNLETLSDQYGIEFNHKQAQIHAMNLIAEDEDEEDDE